MNYAFFNRPADIVARALLGNNIVRKIDNQEKKAVIVETEAYFDETDPASRACFNGDLRKTMLMKAGTILVYGVHNNWLVNIVTDKEGIASAVLIRAVEPLNFNERGNGPGLLTRALSIGKEFHKKNIFDNGELWIEFNEKNKIFEDNKTKKYELKNQIYDDKKSRRPLSHSTRELLITNKNTNTGISFKNNREILVTKISDSKIQEISDKNNFKIEKSFRIGVKKDLPQQLRFYIKGNEWVSGR